MQQECPSQTIMTSRRFLETARSAARFTFIAVAGLLGGCAALPDDAAVVEQLDPETGLTIARLGRPIELYRETFRKDTTNKFAFFGPFETNQMGRRELYLYVALPLQDPASKITPVISADGTPLALGEPGRAPDFAGLQHSPYKIPMSWIATYFYKIDRDLVTRLGGAASLRIQVTEPTKEGTLKNDYSAQLAGDPRLREFSDRQN